jgi:hypothetical protein
MELLSHKAEQFGEALIKTSKSQAQTDEGNKNDQ